MIYQSALEHEIYEMKHAHEIHADYDYEQLQEYIGERYDTIMMLTEKMKEQENKISDKK